MKNLRLSVHSTEYIYLRNQLIQRRLDLGLSQRELAQKMGVIHSFIGKVETGDRRLDIFELIEYCEYLEWDCVQFIQDLQNKFKAA